MIFPLFGSSKTGIIKWISKQVFAVNFWRFVRKRDVFEVRKRIEGVSIGNLGGPNFAASGVISFCDCSVMLG